MPLSEIVEGVVTVRVSGHEPAVSLWSFVNVVLKESSGFP